MTNRNIAPGKRKYRGTVQAEVAALTRQHILDAAIALYEELWVDQITLEQVANRAGVTVQTIIRHFGSKEGLFSAAGRAANERAIQHREEAPVGDLAGAVDNLIEHYEEVGNRVIRLLAQEGRYSELDALLKEGRVKHREWVIRVFAPLLANFSGPDHERLLAQLTTVCDVYVWKLLRQDSGLSHEQTKLTLLEMLQALLEPGN